jgi:predicted nucleic acid-binding protein
VIQVLDASVVVDLLLHREPAYSLIKSQILTADWLAAPHLLDAEVTQVLRRFVLQNELDSLRAEKAIQNLQDFPLQRYPHTLLLKRAFNLRNNLTIYDALYVALAENLNAQLLTLDGGIGKTPGTNIIITVIE